jgi:NADH-quinone oxidoreductase subunit E
MERDTATRDYRAAAEAIAKAYGGDPDFIIPMLQDLQNDLGHLPPEAARHMAELLHVPLTQLYSVATFYKSFSLVPRGKHILTVCLGTVCYLKGAREISELIQSQLDVRPGGTTADGLFTYQPVNCLGACALAPVMAIDNEYFDKVKPERVTDILATYAKRGERDRDRD